MEGDEFETGFAIVDMLEKKPKIGLIGGWQPEGTVGTEAGGGGGGKKLQRAKAGAKKELEPVELRIGGNIEFDDVSFK